jgi:hypothetical protein
MVEFDARRLDSVSSKRLAAMVLLICAPKGALPTDQEQNRSADVGGGIGRYGYPVARRRILVACTIVLLVAECLLFLFLVTVGWAIRDFMLTPDAPEIAVRIRTVYANASWLALNLIGLGSYVYRQQGLGRAVILFVLVFDFLNSLFAALGFILQSDSSTAFQWLLLTLIPAAGLVLVLMQRRASEPPRESRR